VVEKTLMNLLGEPGAASLSDPFPGMDSCVKPDTRSVGSTSTELEKRDEGGVKNTYYNPQIL
jgi:hypothetical protein